MKLLYIALFYLLMLYFSIKILHNYYKKLKLKNVVNLMGYILERKNKKGETRYRAEIRINRAGYPAFSKVKTFSSKKVAENWIKKQELEISENPNILYGVSVNQNITLSQAIDRYLEEIGDNYSSSKKYTLTLVKKFEIAKVPITKITPSIFLEHINARKQGIPHLGLKGIAPSTIKYEILNIKSVLSYADVMWEIPVDMNGLAKVMTKLRSTRQIASGNKRDRLPTNDELIRLTEYFYNLWGDWRHKSYPMHIIMWFAIYSCRRQDEICRIRLSDLNENSWLVRDLKNPNGSKGNNKTFLVSDKCRKMIDWATDKENRNKMLKLGYDDDLLFPLLSKTVSSLFTNACKVLAIKDLRFHDLRHEGCTRLAEQGCTIPQIQQVSLHDSWSSLQRYVSVVQRKNVLDYDDVMKIIKENR